MRILMTGATGFIGKRLLARLVCEGHSVAALVRSPEEARAGTAYPCQFFEWQGFDSPIPVEALEGVEGVVHLAGENIAGGRWTRARKDKILDSRVLGTRSLVEAIRKTSTPPQVLISASAVGYYGDTGDAPMDETGPKGTGFLSDVCDAWEREVEEAKGIRRVISRFGMVLGEEGGALSKLLPLFKSGLGGPVSSGKQWVSWIHVDDAVSLLLWALETPSAQGVLNAVAPEPVTNAHFGKELGGALHRPAKVPAPAFAVKLLMGEAASLVLDSSRVLPSRTMDLGFRFKYPTLEGAFAEIARHACYQVLQREQFVPVPIERVFPFFSEAKNLEELTPAWLHFEILGTSTPEMQEGTLIDYRLRLHGVPLKWQSRIEEWKPDQRFVDVQVKGPYRDWHHTHEFQTVAGGTLLRDKVRFRLPGGLLGRCLGRPFVDADVKKIFDYRAKIIRQRFGGTGNLGGATA